MKGTVNNKGYALNKDKFLNDYNLNKDQMKFVNIRISKDILDVIDEMAIESMRSRSSQIVEMLKQLIKEQNKNQLME